MTNNPDTLESLIRQSIRNIAANAPITLEEYNNLPAMNTYERQFLIEFLSDEALVAACKYTLSNVWSHVEHPTTYEEAILHKYFPEAVTRLQKKSQ